MYGLVAYRPADGDGELVAVWIGFELLEGPTIPANASACWTAWAPSSATSR
jgi:hypothetical protein